MKVIKVRKPDKTVRGIVHPPPSKSISNRLLIMKALSGNDLRIENLSGSSDTLLLSRLLDTIKSKQGKPGLTELDTGNAGTAMRFLTGLLAMTPGKWVLTGNQRMKKRPIGVLADALKPLGASIEYLHDLGYPPLLIEGRKLKGGEIVVDPGISSQFVSALMMIAPRIPGGLVLRLSGQPVSYPYVSMTKRLMESCGVSIVIKAHSQVHIPECEYQPAAFFVESDWSSAAFWYEVAALADDVDLFLEGLGKESLQGDAVLADIYKNFGIDTEFEASGIRLRKNPSRKGSYSFNFSDFPDIAPSVITTCAVLGMQGRFDGLKSLRIKETDRILAIKNELARIGITIYENTGTDEAPQIEFAPSSPVIRPGIQFKTYDDHRMAMTFAPLALTFGEVLIETPDVVGKSYPEFWNDLKSLGFEIL